MPKRKCQSCGKVAAYVCESHFVTWLPMSARIRARRKKILCGECSCVNETVEVNGNQWDAIMNFLCGVETAFGKRINLEALIQPTTGPAQSGTAHMHRDVGRNKPRSGFIARRTTKGGSGG